jgi:hypothetical protein
MFDFTMLVDIQYFLLFHCLCRYRDCYCSRYCSRFCSHSCSRSRYCSSFCFRSCSRSFPFLFPLLFPFLFPFLFPIPFPFLIKSLICFRNSVDGLVCEYCLRLHRILVQYGRPYICKHAPI